MSFSRDWTRYGMWRVAGCTAICRKASSSRSVSFGGRIWSILRILTSKIWVVLLRLRYAASSALGGDWLAAAIAASLLSDVPDFVPVSVSTDHFQKPRWIPWIIRYSTPRRSMLMHRAKERGWLRTFVSRPYFGGCKSP